MKGTMLEPFEASFAGALLDAERPIPRGITAHNAAIPTRRFAIYRNNVVAGLVKALKSRFPVVEKIVGEEFFAAMARVFVVERPPRSPVLAIYGDEFATFIAAFEPARELAYLADVARLEAARTRAYHAADATPVDARRVAQHSCSRSQEADRLTRRPRSHLPTIRISISLATSRGSSARGSSGTSS